MTDSFKISLAQLNPVVGDIEGNLVKIRTARAEAAAQGAQLVVGTELGVTGYPPEDLILKNAFVRAAMAAVEELAADTKDGGPGLIIGTPWLDDEGRRFNAAAVLDDGKVQTLRFKWELPNYGVFDGKRVFNAGELPGPVNFRGVRLGVAVCEDMWTPDVCETLMESGAEILVVINGSPYERDKVDVRMNHAVARVTENELPLIYVNQVGGQDELVFDGASFSRDSEGREVQRLPAFAECIDAVEWLKTDKGWFGAGGQVVSVKSGLEADGKAMTPALREYIEQNGVPGVVRGMSGGIDSAISAALAVDALGADKVWAGMMPSPPQYVS